MQNFLGLGLIPVLQSLQSTKIKFIFDFNIWYSISSSSSQSHVGFSHEAKTKTFGNLRVRKVLITCGHFINLKIATKNVYVYTVCL